MTGREASWRRQCCLPVLLQRAADQPVFRLDTGIATPGLIDRLLRALETLLPLASERDAFGFKVAGNRQADLDRRGFKCLQNEARHLGINRRCRERLTERVAIARMHALTEVARRLAIIAVGRIHPQTALTADHQTRQERSTGAARPYVLAHLLLILLLEPVIDGFEDSPRLPQAA